MKSCKTCGINESLPKIRSVALVGLCYKCVLAVRNHYERYGFDTPQEVIEVLNQYQHIQVTDGDWLVFIHLLRNLVMINMREHVQNIQW
jgi:hypothetical protein